MRKSPPSTRDWATKHLHKLDKADVAAALRELGNFALLHPSLDVAAIGQVILSLARQRRLEDLLGEVALVRTGGPATARAAVLLRFRDQMIRKLYCLMLPRPTASAGAKAILQQSRAYARRLKRDLDAGRCNGGPAEQILFEIARAGVSLPESQSQIIRIIKNLEIHPVGPSDAEPSVVQTDP